MHVNIKLSADACTFLILLQESYVTYGDSLRLAGEIISVLGAILILVLEVST